MTTRWRIYSLGEPAIDTVPIIAWLLLAVRLSVQLVMISRNDDHMIRVSVQLQDSSQPIEHTDVINTYQKGDLWCVYVDGEKVYKYPVVNIWRIVEEYGYHGRQSEP